jgi:hypothetical protein
MTQSYGAELCRRVSHPSYQAPVWMYTPGRRMGGVGVSRLLAAAKYSSEKERMRAPRVADVRFVVRAKVASISEAGIGDGALEEEAWTGREVVVSWMVSGERAWTSMMGGGVVGCCGRGVVCDW